MSAPISETSHTQKKLLHAFRAYVFILLRLDEISSLCALRTYDFY